MRATAHATVKARAPVAGALGGLALLLTAIHALPAGAVPLEAVKPGKLRTTGVAHFEDPASGTTVVVTHGGELWSGTGAKLHRVGTFRLDPHTAVVRMQDERIAAWSATRTGLSIRSLLAARFDDGSIRELRLDTAILDARFGPGGRRLVVLMPGELLIVGSEGEPVRKPLPTVRPRFAETDGEVAVEGRGLPASRVDLRDGCVSMQVSRHASPWARVQADRHGESCGGVPATDPAVLAHAEAWRHFQAQRAAAAGDLVSVAAWGFHGSSLESLRPRVEAEAGDLNFGGVSSKDIPAEYATDTPVALVYQMLPNVHPGTLLGGDGGAACLGSVIWVEADRGRRVWLKDELQRLRSAGVRCSENLHVAAPGQVPEREHDAAVFYLSGSGSEHGWRSGVAAPGTLRDDLARFGDDPALKALVSNAPALSPEWTLGPGPGTVVTLDVDGSWVGGVGWDIARATPEGYRQTRLSLSGPVTAIAVDPDGRYAVDSGGHHLKVLFEGGTLGVTTPAKEWDTRWSFDAPRYNTLAPEAWPIEGEAVRLPGRDRVILTGGRPIEVHSWPLGAIVLTKAGLVGLWPDGDYAWRIPDALDFEVSKDLIVVSTRFGLAAYRPPTTKVKLEKPVVEEDTGEGGGRASGQRGGGPGGGGGGPGGGGPGGGGPGGGGPGGGGPGGGGGGPGGGGGGGGPGGGGGGPGGGGGGPGGGGPGGGGPGGGGGGPGGGGGGPGGGGGGPGGGGPGGGGPGGGGPGGGGGGPGGSR